MGIVGVILLVISVASALPAKDASSRIFGGSLTTIHQYPFAVVLLLRNSQGHFVHECGGTIINNRSILTARHCFQIRPSPALWRSRVGSSFASSGGTVRDITSITNHPSADIAVLRISGMFNWIQNTVQAGRIAGPNYNVAVNQLVWAIGWGVTEFGAPSEQLRHVQIRKVNCVNPTNSVMCAGWLGEGGRSQCYGDSGGPVLHNGVVVGVTSGGICGSPVFPGANARVSYASRWIESNA